jgi:hypothetical protein
MRIESRVVDISHLFELGRSIEIPWCGMRAHHMCRERASEDVKTVNIDRQTVPEEMPFHWRAVRENDMVIFTRLMGRDDHGLSSHELRSHITV